MNQWGIMVDLSHPSKEANLQALALSKAPVIASHSSLRYFVPGFERYNKGAITVRHLLTHVSGLRPDVDLGPKVVETSYGVANRPPSSLNANPTLRDPKSIASVLTDSVPRTAL
mgnify:CR=1 FL=1